LVYEVLEGRLVIVVIAVGKRDEEIAYIKALQRKV
jgi:mRNA-degrading endonuclease RelE of RelBE toxin-antitoxin system